MVLPLLHALTFALQLLGSCHVWAIVGEAPSACPARSRNFAKCLVLPLSQELLGKMDSRPVAWREIREVVISHGSLKPGTGWGGRGLPQLRDQTSSRAA